MASVKQPCYCSNGGRKCGFAVAEPYKMTHHPINEKRNILLGSATFKLQKPRPTAMNCGCVTLPNDSLASPKIIRGSATSMPEKFRETGSNLGCITRLDGFSNSQRANSAV